MRKHLTLGIITFLFVFIFAGCGNDYTYEEPRFTECKNNYTYEESLFAGFRNNYTYEESNFEAVVIQCEEGTFHPDASFMATANMYYAQKNYGMWTTYSNLANANGKYDYKITISIDGDNYTVIREELYEVGQYITITKLDTYLDSQLIETEYK